VTPTADSHADWELGQEAGELGGVCLADQPHAGSLFTHLTTEAPRHRESCLTGSHCTDHALFVPCPVRIFVVQAEGGKHIHWELI
jgi:hypothetical protein